jgi:hypothetical protein
MEIAEFITLSVLFLGALAIIIYAIRYELIIKNQNSSNQTRTLPKMSDYNNYVHEQLMRKQSKQNRHLKIVKKD